VAPLLDDCDRQVLAQAQQQELTSARRGAWDGTSVAAASAGVTQYAPLPAESKAETGRLPKSAFAWVPAVQADSCPPGHPLVCEVARRQQRSGTETVRRQRYRCPPVHGRGCPLQAACTPAPQRGRTIGRREHAEAIAVCRERMASAAAMTLDRRRSQTVELVNADWKRHQEPRRFTGCGLRRVRCQMGLLVLTHQLLTLLTRAKESPMPAAAPSAIAETSGLQKLDGPCPGLQFGFRLGIIARFDCTQRVPTHSTAL